MIERINISNFKSLVDTPINLSKFNVLIGLNGVGKTTILQAFDFLSQLMSGKIEEWLAYRNWTATDLASKFSPNSNITFSLTYEVAAGKRWWFASFNRKELACTHEEIRPWIGINFGAKIFLSRERHYRISEGENRPIPFTYHGSIFSQLKDSELPLEILELRDLVKNIQSLELLSPHLMRQRTRSEAYDVGSGGEKLSAFLHSIKGDKKTVLLNSLKEFYPNVVDYRSSPSKGGWKKLSITEAIDGKNMESEVRHINDGLLRVLSVLAQTTTEKTLLLFDEIENGVNAEVVEKLVNVLLKAEQQIIVTTHSPMILNYLDDKTARKSVLFVYKGPNGVTKVRPFFSIPKIDQKLDVMGPGEAFVDTDLAALTEICVELDRLDDEKKKGAKS